MRISVAVLFFCFAFPVSAEEKAKPVPEKLDGWYGFNYAGKGWKCKKFDAKKAAKLKAETTCAWEVPLSASVLVCRDKTAEWHTFEKKKDCDNELEFLNVD